MKIEDAEKMIDDVSKTAYDKACEVVAKAMHDQTMKQDIAIIRRFAIVLNYNFTITFSYGMISQ